MKKVLQIVIGMILVLGSLTCYCTAKDNKVDMASVYITSEDPKDHGREWIEKNKSHKAEGSIRMTDEDGRIIYDGSLKQIKGRGNSTWEDPKKPYQIKLDKAFDLCETGLSEEANKTWVLLSGYRDHTLMRNQVTFAIADAVGVNFTPHCRQVNLYYDGEYRGVYLLCEKTEVGKGRIEITDLAKLIEKANPGISPEDQPLKEGKTDKGLNCQTVDNLVMPDQDGGYLLEMDYEGRAKAEASWFQTENDQYVVVKSPEYLPESGMNYISHLYQSMERAIYNGGVDPESGKDYREFVDVESLAKVYLVEEFSEDVDAFKSSQYFYKPEGEDKLYAGPVWDFDLGYGDQSVLGSSASAYGYYAGREEFCRKLLSIPSFQEEVRKLFEEKLCTIVQEMSEQMRIWAFSYQEEILRNSELWPDNTTGNGIKAQDEMRMLMQNRMDFLAWEISRWDGTPVTVDRIFQDVLQKDWYYQDIWYMKRNNLMNGDEYNYFDPEVSMNRAMVVTVLYRMAGSPEVEGECSFTDVPSDMWYSDAVVWAEEKEIIKGVGDGLFDLDSPVTRQDFVTLLHRYLGSPEGEGAADLSRFPDAEEVEDYALKAFEWACQSGIIRGSEKNLLLPSDSLRRSEAAAIFHRLLVME